MLRRVLLASALLLSVFGVHTASAAGEQPGCRSSLGLGGSTPIDTDWCDGAVRPGVQISTSIGGCTANFLWNGSNGKRYLGTAGHCLLAADGETTTFSSPVVQAYVNGWRRIGVARYAILNADRDFALIELDAGVTAYPDMAHFGGPTDTYTGTSLTPLVVHHYGWGLGISELFPARTSLALNTIPVNRVGAVGIATFGDSGGPAITGDGKALGVVVTLGHISASPGGVGISRLDFQVPRAAAALGTTLTLQTAPLRP